MNALLHKLWQGLQRAPAWLWGAAAGTLSLLWMYLRMRSAEAHALKAENDATEAKVERDTADAGARAALHTERADALAAERVEVHKETAAEVRAAEDLDDADVNDWTRQDAERRLREKGRQS